jgi:RNA polymerase sigma factor (sigma-70 family)
MNQEDAGELEFETSPGRSEDLTRHPRAGSLPTYADRIAQLFRDEYKRVVHYLVAHTGSSAEARDIAAQAFKQVLELDAASVEQPKAYVYKMARNIATDRARAAAIRRRLNHVIEPTSSVPFGAPEPLCVEAQRRELLHAAIRRLPPRWRMAFILSVCYELPHAAVLERFAAVGVEINERTLRRWIANAVAQCRSDLERADGDWSVDR